MTHPAPAAYPNAMLSDRLRDGHTRQKSARRAYVLIRSAIRNGDLPRNGLISEEGLIRDLGTSRNAVRAALQWLGAEGIVMRRPRIGTVVATEIGQFPVFECSEDFSITAGVTAALSLIETADVPATAYLTARLGEEAETFRMSEFLIWRNGEAVGIFSRYGREAAPVLEQPYPSLTGPERTWFRRIHREAPGRVEVTIEATPADDRTARMLDIEPGDPLLVRETLYWNQAGEPTELHFCFFDARRASLRARG